MVRNLYFFLNLFRGIPAYLLLQKSGAAKILREETKGYAYFFEEDVPASFFAQFHQLMCRCDCYRSQAFYRCLQHSHICSSLIRLLFPIKKDLEIEGEIAEGLVIYHGHGTVIAPYKMGKNCSVYQGVTIGANTKPGCQRSNPIIGDNVCIYTNAVVAGGITIGDNVSIGAGAVVMKDVPSNSVVIGNPCSIKQKKNQDAQHLT